jgi:hypothetical protein
LLSIVSEWVSECGRLGEGQKRSKKERMKG